MTTGTLVGALISLAVLAGALIYNHHRNPGDRPTVVHVDLAERQSIASQLADACEDSRGHTMPDVMSGKRAR